MLVEQQQNKQQNLLTCKPANGKPCDLCRNNCNNHSKFTKK